MNPQSETPRDRNYHISFTPGEYGETQSLIKSFWDGYGDSDTEWNLDDLNKMVADGQKVVNILAKKLNIQP